MRRLYNGYCFHVEGSTVYNPFSFLRALRSGELENYWFDSGTPSFLVEIFKQEYAKKNLDIFSMDEFEISKMEPKYFDADAIPLAALLFQTGYLTVKEMSDTVYKLGFPNLEVQAALQDIEFSCKMQRQKGKKSLLALSAESRLL